MPRRRSPIRIRQSFYSSVNVFVRTLSNDKCQELSTVCPIPDGSPEGSAAPWNLDPEHAQVRNILALRSLCMEGCQLAASLSINPFSHSTRGGIVENGRPNAAWKFQNQQSRWNSLNSICNLCSLTDWSCTSSPKFKNRDSMSDILGATLLFELSRSPEKCSVARP